MIKFLLFSFVFLFTSICKGQEQYGIINDHDGFTNIRQGPSTKHKILSRVYDNEVFYIEESTKNWYLVYLVENGYDEGYIHSSRVTRLSELDSIGDTEYTNGSLTIKDVNFRFSIERSTFNKSEHQYKLQDNKWVIEIDGKRPYGVDGNYPSTQISKITFNINGRPVNIPKSAFSDLYEVNFSELRIFRKKDDTLFVSMTSNSDGAGGYDAIWIFKNGEFHKRVVITL